MKCLALVGTAAGLKLGHPDFQGISIGGHHQLQDGGAMNLRRVIEDGDEPETTRFAGENIEQENADDQNTHWGTDRGTRRHIRIMETNSAKEFSENEQFWGGHVYGQQPPTFFQFPEFTGISIGGHHSFSQGGAIELRNVISDGDEPEPTKFAGENIEKEAADDANTHWGMDRGTRRQIKIKDLPESREHNENEVFWGVHSGLN